MTKLLFISQAGVHVYVRHLWRAFARSAELQLTVIAPTEFYPHHVGTAAALLLDAPRDEDGYRLVPVPLRDPHDYGKGFHPKPLATAVNAAAPDIVHVLDEPVSRFMQQAALLRLKGRHRWKLLCYGFENLPFHNHPLFLLKWRVLLSQLAAATASNTEALDNLKRQFRVSVPCRRIFWGTSMELYQPYDKGAVRKDLDLPTGFLVGGVGGFLPQKGFHILLEALQSVSPEVHCVLLGGGPERARLEALASSAGLAGRVTIVSQVPPEKVPQYMAAFDLLAVPSLTTATWKEQFGKVIAEAMACGTPVITSDSGAIPEVVGDAGVVVPEGDIAALAAAISSLYADTVRRQDLAQRGLLRARDELSMEKFVEEHVRLYQELVP